jgi:hypothetical protein
MAFSPQAKLYRLTTAASRRIIVPTFGEECCVVSATGPGAATSNLTTSSLILTRLSAPSFRPNVPREIRYHGKSNLGPLGSVAMNSDH